MNHRLPLTSAAGAALCVLLPFASVSRAQTGTPFFTADFESDANADNWPDGWTKPAGVQWLAEDGNHFLRLEQTQPGASVFSYRKIPLPSGLTSCTLTFRVRLDQVVKGDASWKDARLVMHFLDAQGAKLKTKPKHPNFSGTTADWKPITLPITIPPGAVSMEVMPTLMMIDGGRFDIDDIKLTPSPQ
ncbi:MAG: hypothetical protein WC661_08155 [Opitutaceae bacterium]